MKRVWLVLPDPFSIRVFFDTGIVDGLRARLDDRLAIMWVTAPDVVAEWADRAAGLPMIHREEVRAPAHLGERVAGKLDRWLDRQIGYFPLGIRLNQRFGFHSERMSPGHDNFMLDSARVGPLPRWSSVERGMKWWFFSPRRHVRRVLMEMLATDCSALVVSNVQPQSVTPFLTAARRLSLPVVAYVFSWDHTVGKGVISPHCDRYIVQNRTMEDDLRQYHDIESSRVVVTGWPQSDVFHRRRPRADYDALLRTYGLDPARPVVLFMGNTPTNAPYEGRLVERLVAWWEQGGRDRFQLLFRPHPRDREWEERYGTARGREGIGLQQPSFTDLDLLTVVLQHVDVAVGNAGTVFLDALINDRPAVCVVYDEGAPPGESWAAKNVLGKHYEELVDSGAFYRAESFDDVVAGIDRGLAEPRALEDARRRVVREIVGDIDGRAAERVVDAMLEVVGSTV
jgi:hypothetical protein